jgi:alkylation response protein AidB-like acyl-CoA dehydrogenase
MADYRAPLREMRFILNNLVDLEALCQLPAFDHIDAEMVDAVLEEAAKLASGAIAPLNESGDRQGSVLRDGGVRTPDGFKEAYKAYVEGGWNGVPFSPEFGGGGLPWVVGLAVQEMWSSSNMAFSLCPLLNQGAVELLEAHGSDALKSTYLAKMISGEWTGTMNLTEPQAGSDVGALRSKAEPAGDGTWRISGTKIFITYGDHDMAENIVHLVLARTPGAPAGTKGISCFVVPKFLVNQDGSLGKANDLRCVSVEHKLGIHASPTCVMSFGDEGECVGYLIGEENRGMRYMFTMMNNARLSVGLQGVSIGERAYQQALGYAVERKQGRHPGDSTDASVAIVEHAEVRRSLMTMKAQVEAMRALVYVNAEAIDKSRHHPDAEVREASRDLVELLTPVSKAWSTDLGCEVASTGVQIHGGMGFIEETGAAQHYRDVRIAPIYEGTNGIQALDLVGRKLPMKGGAVVRDYLDGLRALDSDLAAAGDDFAAMRKGLADGVSALSEATDWMLGILANDYHGAAAGAAPYLRMFGIVTGGFLLARSALAAAEKRAAGDNDPFNAAKIATARFFAEQILPLAPGLKGPATQGAELMFALDPEQMAG